MVLPFYPDLVLEGAIGIDVALKIQNPVNLGTTSIKVCGKRSCQFRQQHIKLGGLLILLAAVLELFLDGLAPIWRNQLLIISYSAKYACTVRAWRPVRPQQFCVYRGTLRKPLGTWWHPQGQGWRAGCWRICVG